MAFIEDSAPQKIRAKISKYEIFCGTGFYKRREINCKEKKKDELSPAIGKNYINKNVSFLPVRVRTQTGLFAFLFLVLLFVKEGCFPPVYKKQYSSSLPGNALTQVNYYLPGWVYCSFFLLLTARWYFFLSQREDVFNLPVKTQKKICSGRSFGNIKIFQPGNWKGFFTM